MKKYAKTLNRTEVALQVKLSTACREAYHAQERKTCDRAVKQAVSEAVWHVFGLMCDEPEFVKKATQVTLDDVANVAKSIRGKR